MKRTIAAIVAVAATVSLGLTGCGNKTEKAAPSSTALSGEITFQTWSLKSDKFTPYFEKLVKDFETANPGTKIKWVDQPGDGYEDKIMQQAQSKQLPDVVNLPQDFAYQLAKVGKLADLAELDPDAMKLYVPGGLAAYQYDGIKGTYGYPWYLGTDLNWWNTKAFADAGMSTDNLPNTFDELYSAAMTIAEKTSGQMPLISSMPGLDTLASNGTTVFKDGKFTFNDDKAVALITKFAELYKAKAAPPELLANDYTGNAKLYIQGKVAWTTAGSGFPGDLKKDAPSLVDTTKATKRTGDAPLFVQGISVAKESKNANLALAFAKFATNNENQVDFVKIAQGFLPGTVEANNNPASFTAAISDPLKAEAIKLAAEQMPNAKIQNPVQYTNDMDKNFKTKIALAIKGEISAKDALDQAVKYCNANMVK